MSDPGPLSENLLNNLKHIEDLTRVLKKEKETTTFPLLLPSFMENVVSFYFVARHADSYTFNPSLPFVGVAFSSGHAKLWGPNSLTQQTKTTLKTQLRGWQTDRMITDRKRARGLASPPPSPSWATSSHPSSVPSWFRL